MSNRTFTKPQNKNSTPIVPVFGRKEGVQKFDQSSANENEIHKIPNLQAGHNFGDIKVNNSQSINQSRPQCLADPRAYSFGGACHFYSPKVQAKLKIGQPNDKYEQEADRVAEQV
ncbi:MAG: hypothetical protein KAS52_02830, partial [Candidatus Heimdallarchaeota archaeon]|nr:hypothetical protein [Candidatus Heimdallarchaeota archaeon]